MRNTRPQSIRLLHHKIGLTLKRHRVIFFLANLIFLLLFIGMGFLHLKDSAGVWKALFLDRLRQVEKRMDSGSPSSAIPVVHELIIGMDGTVRHAPAAALKGMILNASGFFGKIHHLTPGQMAIVFFPDMVDGVQRVHFVKRYAAHFAVNSMAPSDFFPLALAGKTRLSVAEGGIIWFSDDPQWIGNVYHPFPVKIYSKRIHIVFAGQISAMSEAVMIITQDITAEIKTLVLTAGLLLLVFGSAGLGTRKIQKDFEILRGEHTDLMRLIQALSAVVLQPGKNVSGRLEHLAPALEQSLREAGNSPLRFEENNQYRLLVREFTGDMRLLMNVLKNEEEKLRASEEKYRRIFETMADGYIRSDLLTGTILSVNPATAKILGYAAPADLQGKNIATGVYACPQERETMIFHLEQQLALNGCVLSFRSKNGAKIMVETNLHLLFDGHGRAVEIEGTLRDITGRIQNETKLKEYQEHLEDLVRERTSELTREKERAEAANYAKTAFLSNMSHELRTPLNAILGFTQMLTRSRILPPEQRKQVDIIQFSGEHLLALINQVLDLSKIEAGRAAVDMAAMDLYRLLDDLHDLFQWRANEKGLELLITREADVPRHLQTDELKLRQVLINLLNNALKFTARGHVSLRVACSQKSAAAYLSFAIEDTGPGIAPEETAHIFEAFVQKAAGKKAQEGAGLGLSISQKFARLLGGDITVRSTPGNGATFTFEIPYEPCGMDPIVVRRTDAEKTAEPPDIRAADPILPDPRALAALPEELRQGLRRAVDVADMERIQALIARIQPQNAPLAHALAALADNYRLDTLLLLLRQNQV